MANERITENYFRNFVLKDKSCQENKIIFEEQSSKNVKIDKLLRNASKNRSGKGYPEFIIQFKENPDFIIVIECKADIKFHESHNKNKYKDYAVDVALLYSSFLSKEFDVLSIAISGEEENNLRISHFLQLKNTDQSHIVFKDDKFLPLEDYLNGYQTDERKFNQDFQELLKYSKTLNDKLHTLKVPESNRSLLISGSLIALTDKAFCNSYKLQNPKELSENLINTIKNKLTNVQNKHIDDIVTTYSFITTHTILAKKENELKDIITNVNEKINNFIKTYKYFDTLGQFYIEFLRYANNDKGLGIVLTPPHITELFTEIANINKDSVVLDTCTGTGGFLISAMKKMIVDAGGDLEKENHIKLKQIVGVELQHSIFSLTCSNMYIHGDGRSNLIKGSCFDHEVIENIKTYKPNAALLNPPYKATKNDNEELDFILNSLSLIEKGSLSISIVPMLCATSTSGIKKQLKEKLLKEHTLEAVFSMPNELFHNSNATVNTCVMVFKAKEKHPENYKTYFGYWKKDGFIKIKNIGRTDFYHKWNLTKKNWLDNYINKEEIPGHSIKKFVSANDEWCAEAYMETDYSTLTREDFIENIKAFLAYKLLKKNSDIAIKTEPLKDNNNLKLNTEHWKYFRYDDGTDNSIFKIKKGRRLTKKDQSDGDIPYVSSSSLNNGIDNYLGNGYTDENCISFACYGSIGEVFYQDLKVWVSDNANVFYVRNKVLTPFLALFLVTVLKLEKFRFSYGMTGKKERLQNFYIKLPVDKDGKPDWEFMKDYIKTLPYSSSIGV
ncbi:MAG: restriction endonuclease subunit S [bacterium]